MLFGAENAAERDGIVVEKFVNLRCNLGHSFFSRFQCRAYVNHANARPIAEQMCLLHVFSSQIKHQKRKLYCRLLHQITHFASDWFSMHAPKGRDHGVCTTTLMED